MPRAFLALIIALALPASASAATRYAAPTGSGNACTQASPCPLTTAVSDASDGDEVIVATGAYGAPGSELTLDDPAAITIRGAVTGPGRPVVNGRVSIGVGSRLEDLEVVSAVNYPVSVFAGGVANRILARFTNAAGNYDACAVNFGGELRNSLCIAAGPAAGVFLQGGAATPLARNVTAIGSKYGLTAKAPATVEAAILQGDTQQDFQGQAGSDADGLNNVLRDVLYVDALGFAPSSTDRINAAPMFRAAGDYREAANSPTVNAGDLEDATTSTADLDLNGNLRKLGAHVDVGAYEFVPAAPVAVAGAQTTSTADGNTFTGTIQTGGARADVEFLGTGAPAQSIPASTSSTPVTAPVTGLGDAPTPYRLRVTTDGGTFTTPEQVAYRAPALTAAQTSGISDTTATLNGIVALKGAPEATVEFVYGSATSAPQTITKDGAVSQVLTGLTPKTTYQWKLRVTRGSESFETPMGTFTTTTAPTVTPTPEPSGEPTVSPSPTASPTPTKPTFAIATTAAAAQKAGQNLLLKGKSLAVKARCGAKACSLKVTGYVTIGKKRYGTLASPKSLKLGAGESGQVNLTANKRLRKRVAKYLKRHPKAMAVIHLKAVFIDADGGKTTKTAKIKVRRLKK